MTSDLLQLVDVEVILCKMEVMENDLPLIMMVMVTFVLLCLACMVMVIFHFLQRVFLEVTVTSDLWEYKEVGKVSFYREHMEVRVIYDLLILVGTLKNHAPIVQETFGL